MKEQHKPAALREKELQLAMHRIVRGRSHTKATKLTIAAVAREAGVSTALIHNHYPGIAEAIRKAQGRASRTRLDAKHQELKTLEARNKELRAEIDSLRTQVASIASLNEVLVLERQVLKARLGDSKVVDLASNRKKLAP